MALWAVIYAASSLLIEVLAPTPNHLLLALAASVVTFGYAIGAAIDAARRLRAQTVDVRPPWHRSAWAAGLAALATTFAIDAALDRDSPGRWRTFIARSDAMSPTLLQGDRFMLDARTFQPRRGDVIVILARGVAYVRRVVGEPGDTVQMKAGRLFVNGEMAAREVIGTFAAQDDAGEAKPTQIYRETIPGAAPHAISQSTDDTDFLHDAEAVSVPHGAVFVLNDNRDNSADSRASAAEGGLGFIPLAAVTGRAATIYWSQERSRILKTIE